VILHFSHPLSRNDGKLFSTVETYAKFLTPVFGNYLELTLTMKKMRAKNAVIPALNAALTTLIFASPLIFSMN